MKLGKFKMRDMLITWEEYKNYSIMGLKFDKEGNPLSRKATRLQFARFRLCDVMLLSRCWLFGHDIKEGGHAGPDSGCITWECKKCGWSGEHTLY